MTPVDLLAAVGPILTARAAGPVQFPFSLARLFSTAPHDSGIANLQTFLLALDLLAAELLPAHRPPDRNLRAYLESFPRRDADRRRMWKQLESIGATLIPVPSLSEGDRGLNYINGLHEPARYLMPAHGGLYTNLDHAAAQAFRRPLPGVEVVPINCAETQRHFGGLHCSVSAF
jgi:hypothetical protein